MLDGVTVAQLGGRHMALKCPALADFRNEFSPLVADCSGVMPRLVWVRNQPLVSKFIFACLDTVECHVGDRQTIFHPSSLVGRKEGKLLIPGSQLGFVTLELWVMRGTCFWSALLLEPA